MVLEAVQVIYCTKCGMPPEYCEYGPDYERVCEPYLKRKYPELYATLLTLRGKGGSNNTNNNNDGNDGEKAVAVEAPTEPWTTAERLTKFYELYVPEKISDVPSLLEKYAGKEDKLFLALAKKYGPEPEDPYYCLSEDDEDDEEDGELAEDMDNLKVGGGGKKRRGIKAKKAVKSETRVLIQKVIRSKRKATTVVVGMDSVEGVKLKDVSKAFSKRFAGSSSVKDGPKGKEIIIQGDHMEAVAEMIANKFKVDGSSIYLDCDGGFVPYK